MAKYTPIYDDGESQIKRAMLADLVSWAGKQKRKPILLRGARQVGKSTLVRQLAKEINRELIEVNFELEVELKGVFKSLKPSKILKELRIHFDKSMSPDKILIFLDEIQACPEAIASMRYFYEQVPEVLLIGAGSLLDFALGNSKLSMPVGRIEYRYLFPISFEEFLGAMNENRLLQEINSYKLGEEFSEVAHGKLIELLKEYFCFIRRAYIRLCYDLDEGNAATVKIN